MSKKDCFPGAWFQMVDRVQNIIHLAPFEISAAEVTLATDGKDTQMTLLVGMEMTELP